MAKHSLMSMMNCIVTTINEKKLPFVHGGQRFWNSGADSCYTLKETKGEFHVYYYNNRLLKEDDEAPLLYSSNGLEDKWLKNNTERTYTTAEMLERL